jgi:hypothetical protein
LRKSEEKKKTRIMREMMMERQRRDLKTEKNEKAKRKTMKNQQQTPVPVCVATANF